MNNPYRNSATGTVSRILQKGAEAVAKMDKTSMPMGARLEEQIAKTVNTDPNIAFTVEYVRNKFQIPGDLVITPKVNDNTLMIEKYSLLWYNPRGETQIIIDDAQSVGSISDALAVLISTKDPDVVDEFLANFK